MKNATWIRDRVGRSVQQMLEGLRILIGSYAPNEVDVLTELEHPKQFDLTVDTVNFLMEKLGHATAPSLPKYDKTRRALAKKQLKGPRGVPKPRGRPPKIRPPAPGPIGSGPSTTANPIPDASTNFTVIANATPET